MKHKLLLTNHSKNIYACISHDGHLKEEKRKKEFLCLYLLLMIRCLQHCKNVEKSKVLTILESPLGGCFVLFLYASVLSYCVKL